MAPFYCWGSNFSRLQSHYKKAVYFTIQFPGVPDTQLIDIGRMKGWVDLGATQWF